MEKIDLERRYMISENVVAREIEGEIIIVPLTAGIGDAEDDLFSLNECGKAIWKHLDGTNSVREIVTRLEAEYEGESGEILNDVTGFLEELLSRGILVESQQT